MVTPLYVLQMIDRIELIHRQNRQISFDEDFISSAITGAALNAALLIPLMISSALGVEGPMMVVASTSAVMAGYSAYELARTSCKYIFLIHILDRL